MLDHDPVGARAAFERALTLNPSAVAAHRYYAWFLGVRQLGPDAVAVADRAFSLDPLCIVMQTSAADVRYFAGDFAGALVRSRHALAMEPEWTARDPIGVGGVWSNSDAATKRSPPSTSSRNGCCHRRRSR